MPAARSIRHRDAPLWRPKTDRLKSQDILRAGSATMPRVARGRISREDLPVGYQTILARNLTALGYPGDECILIDDQVRAWKDALRAGSDIPGGLFEPDAWRMRALLNINGIKEALDNQELDDAVNEIMDAEVESDISDAWKVPAAPAQFGSSTTTAPGPPAPPPLPLPQGEEKKRKHCNYGREDRALDWASNLPTLSDTAEWEEVRAAVSSGEFKIAGNVVGPVKNNKSSKTLAQWRYPVECRAHSRCGMLWSLTRAPPFTDNRWTCRERKPDMDWDGVLHWGLRLSKDDDGADDGANRAEDGDGDGKVVAMEQLKLEHTTFSDQRLMAEYIASTFDHAEIKEALTEAASTAGNTKLKKFSAAQNQETARQSDALKLASHYFSLDMTVMQTTPKAVKLEALNCAKKKKKKQK